MARWEPIESQFCLSNASFRRYSAPSSKIPKSVERILLDFILSYHFEKPKDIIEHGCKYFSRLSQCLDEIRRQKLRSDMSGLSIDYATFNNRRASVTNEGMDLEDTATYAPTLFEKSLTEIEMLENKLRNLFLFRHLEEEEINKIISAMEEKNVKEGEVIIEQGFTEGTHLYVIEQGVFEATTVTDRGDVKILKRYKDDGIFGELALMYNTPRAATVTALTGGKLWLLDRSTFQRTVLIGAFKKRKRYQDFVEGVEFLNQLDYYAKLDLADALIPKYYNDGEVVFYQGQKADGMYFIESGNITCFINHPILGNLQVIELGPREYFGELALVTQNPRALTATAKGETKLAFLDKDAYERLLGPCNEYFESHIEKYKQKLSQILDFAHFTGSLGSKTTNFSS